MTASNRQRRLLRPVSTGASPSSRGDGKRHWVKPYGDELPPHAERLMTLQSWDTASKGGPDNDWPVCTTWLLTRKKRWYLIDVWRRQVDYPAPKAAAQSLAKQ